MPTFFVLVSYSRLCSHYLCSLEILSLRLRTRTPHRAAQKVRRKSLRRAALNHRRVSSRPLSPSRVRARTDGRCSIIRRLGKFLATEAPRPGREPVFIVRIWLGRKPRLCPCVRGPVCTCAVPLNNIATTNFPPLLHRPFHMPPTPLSRFFADSPHRCKHTHTHNLLLILLFVRIIMRVQLFLLFCSKKYMIGSLTFCWSLVRGNNNNNK